jgi:D-3-phosphoglycerate dehydrogenase / 2-oxoglutarate reductase
VTSKIVVALGSVQSKIVQPILGPHINFIENPSSNDLTEASGAIVRANYHCDQALFEKMPNLKVIARTGVGVELVDLIEADRRKIIVLTTPGANSKAVAEGAFAHILALSKRLQPLTKLVREDNWNQKESYPVGDLSGETLGVIGYGRIGKIMVNLAHAFEMKTIVFDPNVEIPMDLRGDLDTLYSQSDYISLHIPYSAENSQLINQSSIKLMKDGVILVNCSRGGLINLDDALAALLTGKVGGIGLDAFENEPPEHHPIFDHENAVLTPHLMGLSRKSTVATYQMAAQGVRDVLEDKNLKSIANLRVRGS